MWALVLDDIGPRIRDDAPDTALQEPEDAIVRVDAVTICGADLDILSRSMPDVEPGRVLGHEAVGTVDQVGEGVRGISVGDRVVVSCVTACGRCQDCCDGEYGHCLDGGWRLGRAIDGTHAEFVRVPYAAHSLHRLPDGDEQALMLAEVVPTAYEAGTLAGQVSRGDTVVIAGAGPVGLAAMVTSRLFTPKQVVVVDPVPYRQQAALKAGADYVLHSSEARRGRPGRPRAHGRTRCGRGDRGGRHCKDVRAVCRDDPACRPAGCSRCPQSSDPRRPWTACGSRTPRSQPGWPPTRHHG
jgi:alcohol dehydrogenase